MTCRGEVSPHYRHLGDIVEIRFGILIRHIASAASHVDEGAVQLLQALW